MTTPGAVGLEGAAASGRVKYRLSCDRCQNIKVRCSQDKPACKRCSRKGFACVYSPFRRIGRPKKSLRVGNNVNDDEPGANVSSMSIGTATPSSEFLFCSQTRSSDRWLMLLLAVNAAIDVPALATAIIPIPEIIAQSPLPEPQSESTADCYIDILSQSTRFEKALSQPVLSPPIDLVLSAERCFGILRRRLFTCTGHPPHSTHSCLSPAADRPVFLSLALLANRIVGMLEEMFRVRAKSAPVVDAVRELLPWLTRGTDETVSGLTGSCLSARRKRRSRRMMSTAPCASPVVEASGALRIGGFTVDGMAKNRTIGRILIRRVRRMLGELRQMQGVESSRSGAGYGQPPGRSLGWDGSGKLLDRSAEMLVDDLIRRIEALQGTMVLLSTRSDGMM
jgi:hypothetical protein